jgi:hypothetical protein
MANGPASAVQRIAGIAYLKVDGNQMALRGNFTVSPTTLERTMIAGQDGVHGYQELPRVPFIEGDISLMPNLNLMDLQGQVGVTVIAQLANQKQYTLGQAICKSGFDANTRDGQARVRWEGITINEGTW